MTIEGAPGAATGFGAIVPAGGRGSRLGGRDKAALTLGARTTLDLVLGALGMCDPVVVVGPADLQVPAGVLLTREDPPFGGPAAAVAAGSSAMRAAGVTPGWSLLVACDLPGASGAVGEIVEAASAVADDVDAVFATDVSGRPQWLLCAVRTAALTRAVDGLGPGGASGRSMRTLLGDLAHRTIGVPDVGTDDIDTPEDLERWRRRMAQAQPGSTRI